LRPIQPDPNLAACLHVLYRAAVDARSLGWKGEQEGLTRDESRRLADLMDAVHNIPKLAADWEKCDERLLRGMLGDYDARHGGALLEEYDRIVSQRSRSS
jgi:hypothetical protein